MKLLWFSVAPWTHTGYGVVTKEMVRRLKKEGHEVWIATKHFHTDMNEWEGSPVICGMNVAAINRLIEKDGIDYAISLLDIYTLPQPLRNWICWCPINEVKISSTVTNRLKDTIGIIAMSKHGQQELKRVGYPAEYIPLGVDVDCFKPDENARQKARQELGWEGNFIIGSVGINYTDERKNFTNLLLAFQKFYKSHPDARLYLSTNPSDDNQAFILPDIAQDLGILEAIQFSDPDSYYFGKVKPENVANRYRAFDVLCMPTKGEGFGLPLIEAQACGTPVITTDASTGPELTKGGWLIKTDDDDWQWYNQSWRISCKPSAILERLEEAYSLWQKGKLKQVGRRACRLVQEYNWDNIFETLWKPILATLPTLKQITPLTPDYYHLYGPFSGRLMMGDCGTWCKNKPCEKQYPYLPFEPKVDRPILSRSYPLFPNENGDLMVNKACPLHGWMSKRFVIEAGKTWKHLWTYPLIRKFMKELWDKEDKSQYIGLYEIEQDFDAQYKWAMQSQYTTNLPNLSQYINNGHKVLEVGCGDGKRVKAMQELGIDAIGIEINDAWLQPGVVEKGNAEKLDYPDNSFDIVLSVDLLEHLDDPLKAVGEMFRVSRDKVIASLTPIDDRTFWEDPTHRVEWDTAHWMRELNEFGEIIEKLSPTTFVMRKRK